MKEILLTSSVLILALLALRRLFRRTISRRMQYTLWALVLVRLLVPLNVGTLAHNVLSAAEPVQTAVEKRLETPVLYMQDGTERHPAQLLSGEESQGDPQSPPSDAAQSAPADEYSIVTPTYRAVALSEALTYVWYAGMLIVGAWFLFTNLRFARALRKARTPYSVEGCRYPVYLVSALPSPCLFGVLRPAIYLNNAAAASPELLRFVLAHEQTHARHLDPLWSLLRGLCLTVYWFDPLVWLAAVLSREDGELACDEGTLRALGADERTADGTVCLSEHLALVRIGSAHPKKTVAVNPAWSTLYLTLPDADGGTAEPLTINFIREYDAPGSTEAVYSLNIGTRDAAKSYKVLSGQEEIDAFLAYLRGEAAPEQISQPAFPNNLTEAERSVVDEFLHWAQALRAEDIHNLQFRDGSGSRYLVDAELTALSAQLVPALNALTEAELYTQRGYGDSTYYTLAVNLRDGTQYTFLCGFDCVRLLSPAFEPALSSSYPSNRPTLWLDSPALMACIDSLEASPAPLPDFETAAPTPLADILPAREPWMTIPLAGKAQRIADRRIPSDALDWLTQMDMDGDGVCEIVNSSPNFPAIYYKRGGELYGVDLKSVITAAWPEMSYWDYTSAAPASRSILLGGLSAGDAPGDGINFTRYLYFDGESLLLYKPDRSHTDHVADATLADPSVPAEIVARAKQLVRQRYDTLAGSAAQYDDWYTDVSFLGAETRYEGLTLEVYSSSQHYHAQKPENILLAGGTEVDEDGWAFLDGDTVLDGPYIVCLTDGGTRRMLEGSMSGDCSTGSPAYYADLTALLAKNNVLRPDALDGGRLNEVMSSSGISFLNWLGQYDAAEQDRALERLSAYRTSLTDSYDLDMFSRIVAYLLGDRDGLTDAGRAAQARFRAMFG